MLSYKNTNQFLCDYRAYLANSGITNAHVARKMNISPQQLQNLYRKQELTVSDVQSLCKAINMQCDIVIARTESN